MFHNDTTEKKKYLLKHQILDAKIFLIFLHVPMKFFFQLYHLKHQLKILGFKFQYFKIL